MREFGFDVYVVPRSCEELFADLEITHDLTCMCSHDNTKDMIEQVFAKQYADYLLPHFSSQIKKQKI